MRTAKALQAFEFEPEQQLTQNEFTQIAKLVEGHTGIRLPQTKKVMLEGRLRKRLKAHGLSRFGEYFDLLFKSGGLDAELPTLIDVVTTNKTDFFREADHFDILTAQVLPDLLTRRQGSEAAPLIKVWSAASSTGAEAYTLAMVLHDQAMMRRSFRFAILGTDISNTVLEQGERAVYAADMMEPVPKHFMQRYVMQSRRPQQRAEVRIAPELRRHVHFAHLNLMDENYPFDRDVDIIFLRNVLIYFERKDQEAVVRRLVGHLRPGGYLFLGHSESMNGNTRSLRQVAPAVFQKL